VIGVPFYVMEKVDGVVVRDTLPPALDGERSRIGHALVDALAALHAVDWMAVGLEGWGKPDGYLDRQLRRWQGQLELTLPLTRPLPDLLAAGEWLRGHLPAPSGPATIVHGDYKLDNVMLAPAGPARVAAILDWEMSTIGDPLADLGWLLSFWHQPGEPDDELGLAGVTGGPGFATRSELMDRYRERTGRDPAGLGWYRVLAMWKLAILLEGSYARHLAGHTDDPFFARMETAVPALSRRAVEVAGHG
jgi:aminoglycoside phosphotransferase (APT) family kinase protein